MSEVANTDVMAKTKPAVVKITREQIKGYLNQGKTRDEIAEILGLNKSQVKAIFSDKALKGLKTKVAATGFEFTDGDFDPAPVEADPRKGKKKVVDATETAPTAVVAENTTSPVEETNAADATSEGKW